ncbi:hypothetical protein COU18_01500 [Candidatus Kaiserbacteria bacterium CG10_big_fil_rev_8_21_14_0_10_51_14]|uniref:Peptidase M50 domain-containing protein n=1 Tax=Candidatus Kaiserbacteria bacterium CG10_big_fil_rev_8_21_14_0_10_51_14 TaxID=1974610 RepID=A0A2H0UCB2_9BACT|nr:MAG: hypothetical protein COU18_01500 [Candidatus Kaiserbacteria bacterium CG10_big_fil_rev_8_21_14_0_10_51_14]
MLTVLLVVGILVLLIVAHELGHFFVAKIFRVRVEEFGIGYPPRALRFGKIGDTEYTFNWIPFGGFVRLFGDVGEKKHGRGSYVDAPRGVQAAILVAGVLMNVVVAWGLFATALHIGVPRVVEAPIPNQPTRLIVAHIVPSSPADHAGLHSGDEIIDVVGDEDERPKLLPSAVVDFVKGRGGEPIRITYIQDDETKTTSIIPANAVLPNAAGQPALGIALALVANVSLPWNEAAIAAFHQTGSSFTMVLDDLKSLVGGAVRGDADVSELVGPVGIVSYVGQASQNGWGTVLLLAAVISINLAIINLIPIPALDGGRLAVLAIEGTMRRNAPRVLLQLLNTIGIGLIILLMIVVTYNDIGRLLF